MYGEIDNVLYIFKSACENMIDCIEKNDANSNEYLLSKWIMGKCLIYFESLYATYTDGDHREDSDRMHDD